MPRTRPKTVRVKVGLALLLTWVGGYVDGVGYLLLAKLFTSHQSGNTVVLGVSAGAHDWQEVIRRGFPIMLFVSGIIGGTVLSRILAHRGVRSMLVLPLALEAVLLALFMLFGALAVGDGAMVASAPVVFYPLAALLALAMGLQNTALHKVGSLAVRTTFVSGTLSVLAEAVVEHACWFIKRQRGQGWRRFALLLRLTPRQPSWGRLQLLAGVWLGFAGGAVCGALALLRLGIWSLTAPVAALVLVCVVDLLTPISAPDSGTAKA